MHRITSVARRVLATTTLGAVLLAAQSPRPRIAPPDWAMPLGNASVAAPDSAPLRHVPGSRIAFTQAQVRDLFSVPDWFPDTHPAMPPIVSRGRPRAVGACGYCHLPDGAGRPENAALAGLPAAYIARQVAAMRDGTRASAWRAPNTPWSGMRAFADSMTPSEVDEAARYFASLTLHRPRARVVEAERIPRLQPGRGLYFLAPSGGDEPLGDRLVEVATDAARHELHDANVPYVAYVPPGSIARGRALATHGVPAGDASGGRARVVTACASCHGAQLRGAGLAPPLAGRSPSYLLRQLLGFAAGARTAPEATPMRAVADALRLDDMIAAAAYAASRAP